jgi:hypothetical protein
MVLQYEQDLFIDESALDVECLNQPLLMRKYTKELAKAEKEVARLKELLDIESAILDKDVRISPQKHGLVDVKITNDVVASILTTSTKLKGIRSDIIEAVYEMNMVKGAVDAVRQRKDMLQELIKLHGQNYFAGPSVPRDLASQRQIKKEQANTSIKIKRTT